MIAYLRSVLLAAVLMYGIAVSPSAVLAAGTTGKRHKAFRFKVQRVRWLAVKHVAPPMPIGALAVSYAKRFIGAPYRWGGSSPSGFDCSGFVRYVYGRFGVDLPHSSYADFGVGRYVPRDQLKPGDLVFFNGVGHVGMYVGNGRFIHAPHSGTSVQISTLASHGGYDGARRIVSGFTRRLLGR